MLNEVEVELKASAVMPLTKLVGIPSAELTGTG
jgi:hypothetical protein